MSRIGFPGFGPFQHRQMNGALAPGATCSNGVAMSELHPVAGCARLRVRLKATVGGTLTINYLRPIPPGKDVSVLDPQGTGAGNGQINPADAAIQEYATGDAASVAVTANTEAKIDDTPYGETWALVKFVPSGAGAIVWCDISTL